MARSGIGAVQLLLQQGATVYLNDNKALAELPEAPAIQAMQGWQDRLGVPFQQALEGIDLVVISPSVPYNCVGMQAARAVGIPVIGELELAAQHCDAPIIAITGTNGKTSTTTLVGEIYKQVGPAEVAGNIGLAFSSQVSQLTPQHRVVLEVSSFQLETVETFHPQISAILNITPDHLDRHGTLDDYALAKARIFENQRGADRLVLNAEDAWSARYAAMASCELAWFSDAHTVHEGACLQDGVIMRVTDGVMTPVCAVNEMQIIGKHIVQNALAAVAIAHEVPIDILRTALCSFKGVEHRFELVCEVDGVRYINDSKGTNPDASIKAIEALDRPAVLIAGGMDKGTPFEPFVQAFGDKVLGLVLLGETADMIEGAARANGFTGHIQRVSGIEEAVQVSAQMAQPGMAVLLSPACASWDMFRDFEERGQIFKDAAMRVGKGVG